MLSSCLVFPKSEAQHLEKKVAYKKKLCKGYHRSTLCINCILLETPRLNLGRSTYLKKLVGVFVNIVMFPEGPHTKDNGNNTDNNDDQSKHCRTSFLFFKNVNSTHTFAASVELQLKNRMIAYMSQTCII